MQHFFKSVALVMLLALAACGEKKPERVLVDIVQPDADANYGVFVWRVTNSPNPTTLHFGLAAFGVQNKSNAEILLDLETFGSADFAASEVSYGWSELKQFSVCAAQFNQRNLTDASIANTVMNDVKFSNDTLCDGEWALNFPPRLKNATQE